MQVEKGLTVVDIDGKQAQAELEKLRNRAEQVKDELNQLRKAKADPKLIKQVEREYAGVRKELNKTKRETIDVKKIMDNLSGSSLRDVERAYRKIRTERKAMSREDKNYKSIVATEKRLKAEVDKTNASFRAQRSVISKVSDGFNKYFGLITAGAASMAGVVMGARKAIDAFRELDEKFADVMKTTGLTRDEVEALNNSIAKIDTRTSQLELLDLARVAGKLGITAESEILGFVRAADKVGVALAEDLGGDVEQSVNQLGKLVEIFGISDEFGIEDSIIKIGSTINSLGAIGTSNEQYMIEFAKRVGGIAPVANISAAEVFGLGATLDELGQTSQVSSTAVTKVIGEMFTKTGEYARLAGMDVSEFSELLDKDANEAFIQILKSAKGSGDGFSDLAQNLNKLGLDGARAIGTFSVLANNIDLLRERQAFSNEEFNKGTSLIEEFNVKNNTATAKLEKARKKIKELSVDLGQKLQPAMTHIVSKGSMMLKFLSASVDFLTKHGAALGKLAIIIGTYTAAVKIQNKFLDQESGLRKMLEPVLQKLSNKTYTRLTGQIKETTSAQNNLNKSIKPNIFAAVTAAVVFLTTQLVKYIKKQREVKKAVNEVNATLLQQKSDMDSLFDTLEKAPKSSDVYKDAMKRLNDEYGQYLEFQASEKISSAELAYLRRQATDALNDEMIAMLESRLNEKNLKFYENLADAQSKAVKKLSKTNFTKEQAQEIVAAYTRYKQDIENGIERLDSPLDNLSFDVDEGLRSTVSFEMQRVYGDLYTLNDRLNETKDTIDLFKNSLTNDAPDVWLADLPDNIDIFTDDSQAKLKAWAEDYQSIVNNTTDEAAKQKLITEYFEKRAKIVKTLDKLETPNPTPSPGGDDEDGDPSANEDDKFSPGSFMDDDDWFNDEETAKAISDAAKKSPWEFKLEKDIEATAEYKEFQNEFYDWIKDQDKETTESLLKELEKRTKAEQKALETKAAYAQEFIGLLSNSITAAAEGQEDAMKEFGKNAIVLALKILKDQAELAMTGVTIQSLASPESVATLGSAGIAKAAVMIGLIEAAFAAVQGMVNQWDTGKYPVIGANDGKSYNASFVGSPKTGLYSSPSLGLFNEDPKRPEMVIDSKTTEQLRFNFPHVIDTIYRVAGKQFDSGQYPDSQQSTISNQQSAVSNQQSDINSQQLTSLIENQKALAKSIAILNNQLSRGIGVNYDKLKTADTDIDNIHQKASRS